MKSNRNTIQRPSSEGRTTEISQASTGTPSDVRALSLHEETSARARELWEKFGCPEGRDEEIWLEAEKQVLNPDPRMAGTSASYEGAGKSKPSMV